MADGYISQITLPNNQTYDLKDKNLNALTTSVAWTGTSTTDCTINAAGLKSILANLGGTGLTLLHNDTDGIVLNHTNSITNKTSYASTATTADANGGTITLRDIQYDGQGHITASTDRTITLSTPVISVATLSGEITAGALVNKLGLSNAMHFIGIVSGTPTPSDGGNQVPNISDLSSYTPVAGDVVIDSSNSREYVYTKANTWELLGQDASTTYSVSLGAYERITSISQDSDRTISVSTQTIGVLPCLYGGTNTNVEPTLGGIIYAGGTSSNIVYASTSAGSAGQVLISNGTSAPTWYDGLTLNKTVTNNVTSYSASFSGAVSVGGALSISGETTYGAYGKSIYWNSGVPEATFPVQYTTWTIASGSTSTTITKTGKYFADTYVISLVVSSGENNLNGSIAWETSSNKLKITTSAATSGVVSGYVLTARADSI